MSDLIFNLMVFGLHFQITDRYRFRVSYNPHHKENGWKSGYIRLFELRGIK